LRANMWRAGRFRVSKLFALALVVSALVPAAMPAPAAASYKLDKKWGSSGSGSGQFNGVDDVAVNSAGTRVYVSDSGNFRVQEFTSSGSFIRAWGGHGTEAGQFGDSGPAGIAVSPAGSVWVVDRWNNRIEKFDSTGSYLFHIEGGDGDFDHPLGIAANADGDVYVADNRNLRIERFTGTGTYLTHWDTSTALGASHAYPTDVAVSPSTGHVWASLCDIPHNTGTGGIAQYRASGSFVSSWHTNPDSCPGGIAISPTHKVLVANGHVQVYTASGALADQFGPSTPYDVSVDGSGVVYVTTGTRVYRYVPAPPQTTITGAPAVFTSSTSATVSFASSEPTGATFQCKLDTQGYHACSGPSVHYTGLADGKHTVKVRAIDADGFTDPSPTNTSFTVDTVRPQTTITSGPAESSTINESQPTFSFASSEPGSTFRCAVDVGSFTACSSPHTTAPLADGTHTFQVAAVDRAGNQDSSAAARTFTVDTAAPQTTITSGPGEGAVTSDRTPSFSFSSSKGGSTFECQIDGGAFSACASAFVTPSLADGTHQIQVRASQGGLTDPSPAVRDFTVDATPPKLKISSADVTLSQSGIASVKLTCPTSEHDGPCAGSLELKTTNKVTFQGHTRRVTLGTASYSIAAGADKHVKVSLSSAKRHLVAQHGHLSTDAIADVSDALGNSKTVTRTFELKAS
jgi:streptogramin lyase